MCANVKDATLAKQIVIGLTLTKINICVCVIITV